MSLNIISLSRAVLFVCIFVLAATVSRAQVQDGPVSRSRQTLLVLADGWDSRRGEMRLYERAPGGKWKQSGSPIPVVLGYNGLAWGLGLQGDPGPGPVKREGDGRSVAGIYRLGPVFGADPPQGRKLKMPFRRITESVECVDDPGSPRYNVMLDASGIADKDWRSSETMFRFHDGEYRLGVEVEHNPPPAVPGGGSCIFLHVWRSPTSRTSGCTAMSMEDMERVAVWLDPDKLPLLAQYPESCRELFARAYGLP